MSGIRGTDTKPELVIRRGLHRRGFRYRIHDRRLPGRPDLVFPGRKAVIVVNGCFWHGHDCHLFRWPSRNAAFWKKKISANMTRDAGNRLLLASSGWRILSVWECALKGKDKHPVDDVIRGIEHWLRTASGNGDIRGGPDGC